MPNRIHAASALLDAGIIPLLYDPDPDVCCRLAHTLYEGGARVLEYTNRGLAAHEVFYALRRYTDRHLPGMVLGAGTLMEAGTTALYLQYGADFIVAPSLSEAVGRTCHARNVLWIPGCTTPTEIAQGHALGAEIVKLFPSDLVQPGFVKALRGPMPWATLMVTGGVTPDEAGIVPWFEAGAACVGIGSSLFVREDGKLNESRTSERMQEALQVLRTWRAAHP
jgi:2-dehydro-3-deoxyphosphogluconate aldolase/(4S)-4-hydroxy-2-oxoglutarate aldolase